MTTTVNRPATIANPILSNCPSWCARDPEWHEPDSAVHFSRDRYLPLADTYAANPRMPNRVWLDIQQTEGGPALIGIGMVRPGERLPTLDGSLGAADAERLGRRLLAIAATLRNGASR